MATVLLIIDVQNAILAGKAQAPRQAELDAVLDDTVLRLQHLQGKAREAGHRVILIQHDGPSGHRLEKAQPVGNFEPKLRHKAMMSSSINTVQTHSLKQTSTIISNRTGSLI